LNDSVPGGSTWVGRSGFGGSGRPGGSENLEIIIDILGGHGLAKASRGGHERARPMNWLPRHVEDALALQFVRDRDPSSSSET
jgi:hypothetical protein